MMRFDPFREIEEFTQRMDRSLGQSGGSVRPVNVHEAEWN